VNRVEIARSEKLGSCE